MNIQDLPIESFKDWFLRVENWFLSLAGHRGLKRLEASPKRFLWGMCVKIRLNICPPDAWYDDKYFEITFKSVAWVSTILETVLQCIELTIDLVSALVSPILLFLKCLSGHVG